MSLKKNPHKKINSYLAACRVTGTPVLVGEGRWGCGILPWQDQFDLSPDAACYLFSRCVTDCRCLYVLGCLLMQ